MKKFNFKLSGLLKYREYLERVAQQKTSKAHMDVKRSEQEIINLKETWTHQADVMANRVEQGISAVLFQQYYQHLSGVETSIAQEKIRKVQLENTLKKRLAELKKKSMDKRAMEIYKERLKAEYAHGIAQIEQKELDEISTLKTARTRVR
jgi:flagellar FliJ protein